MVNYTSRDRVTDGIFYDTIPKVTAEVGKKRRAMKGARVARGLAAKRRS